jgi:hypothetical protein
MMVYRGIAHGTLAGATTPNEIDVLVRLRIALFRIFPWSTGFTRSDFCWGAVAPHGCAGGGITVVPKSNGQVLRVGPRASRVAMRAHNGKIGFSLWHYLNLLDLHSLETLAEWTAKAAVLVSLCGQVAHATPPLIRGFGCLHHRKGSHLFSTSPVLRGGFSTSGRPVSSDSAVWRWAQMASSTIPDSSCRRGFSPGAM